MLKNYFKTALRNLWRYRIYTFINVIGLSVGIAAALAIFLAARFELSFDDYQPNRHNIYRISTDYRYPNGEDHNPGVALPIAEALRAEIPAIKEVASIHSSGATQVEVVKESNQEATRRFREEGTVYFAEPQLFKIFSFEWITGTPETSLKEPGSVALAESMAKKYFRNPKEALGRLIRFNQKNLLKVTGIFKDPPTNTDLPLKIVGSYATFKKLMPAETWKEWGGTDSNNQVFVLSSDNLTRSQINQKLLQIHDKYDPVDEGARRSKFFIAQPLKDIHHDENYGTFTGRVVNKTIIQALILVSVFLILIACINFINLATAQAVNRSKEVGIRKVLGGTRAGLIYQFLGETSIIVTFSVLLSVVWLELILPYMKTLVDAPLEFNLIKQPELILFLIFLTLIVTTLAGFYPAIIMSGFRPLEALKNKINNRKAGGISLRRGLVIFQFIVAQFLIIGMLVAIYQMNYMNQVSMGFDKEAIVNIPLPRDEKNSPDVSPINSLGQDIQKLSGITKTSFSSSPPASNSSNEYNFNLPELEEKGIEDIGILVKFADVNYLDTYNIPLLEGRMYNKSDTLYEIIVNETAVKKLGFSNPKEIVGKLGQLGSKDIRIVGVIKDFHLFSLHDKIEPCMIAPKRNSYYMLSIKLSHPNFQAKIKEIKKIYAQYYPQAIFEYQFLDEDLAQFYDLEQRLLKLFQGFAFIAILISALGLYGLVSFMANQRLKEVGIRKVLGAKFTDICLIFYREFAWLVLIAFIVAAPLGWIVMNAWLQDFAYRILISWDIFMLAGVGVMFVAISIISSKVFRTANINPIEILRDE